MVFWCCGRLVGKFINVDFFFVWFEVMVVSVWLCELFLVFVFLMVLFLYMVGLVFVVGLCFVMSFMFFGVICGVCLLMFLWFYLFVWVGFVFNFVIGFGFMFVYLMKVFMNLFFYSKLLFVVVGLGVFV